MINSFSSIFLWPAFSEIVNGDIIVRATGYDDGVHWTGVQSLGSETDPFLAWFLVNRFLFPPIMDKSFMPALKEFWKLEVSTSGAIHSTLSPPKDGNYVFLRASSPESEMVLRALFECFGEKAFVSISDVKTPDLSLKVLMQFCRGLAEIFCFRSGKCDLFLALGEGSDACSINQKFEMLKKRIKPSEC